MQIKGDTALVTGGGSGIGESICLELAEHGLTVVVVDIDEESANETVDMIENNGESATVVQMDVSSPEDVETGVSTAIDTVGSIDILINNAGIAGPTASIGEIEFEEWESTLATNLTGPFLLCQELVPTMKQQEYGRVVNISSASGKRPVPRRAPYTASKSGLIGLTQTVAAEGGKYNVNANSICPGAVEGPRIERVIEHQVKATGRPREEVEVERQQQGLRNELIQPTDVAEMAAFLCSSVADRITGQSINVSAGKIVN
jgi:NAD(P)-dependent dehydrogenase (short-subunit alcohol dehydrogenase family)